MQGTIPKGYTMTRGIPSTTVHDAEITARRTAGESATKIARAMNLGVTFLEHKFVTLGLTEKRVVTDEDRHIKRTREETVAEIMEMDADGFSPSEIGMIFGMSAHSVGMIIEAEFCKPIAHDPEPTFTRPCLMCSVPHTSPKFVRICDTCKNSGIF